MLSEGQVIDIIRVHRKDAFGPESMQLTQERAEAMDRYHGRPYGDEEEGYSSFVTRDLAEAVDDALPVILRPFVQSGILAEFRSRNENDAEQSKDESEYINYIIMEENKGVLLLYDCFKDAHILKNCYAKHWWEETTEVIERSWSNVSEEEIAYIVNNFKKNGDTVEIKETELEESGAYDITLTIKREQEGVKIEAVPPEELRISNKCRGSLQESQFVEHIPVKTRSDLLEMGIPKDWLMKQPAKGQTAVTTEERKRDSVTDEINDDEGISLDQANEEMNYTEAYIRIDYDGDGIAELRKIITINDLIPPENKAEDFIPNETIDVIPFTGGVIKRMPHRHIGESYQDDIGDLGEQNTSMTRQMFDNVYHTVHNQWAINNRVEEEDFLEPGAGAVFRVNDDQPIGDSIKEIRPTSIAGDLLNVISFIEEKKKRRIGDDSDIDPNILRETTKGAFLEFMGRKTQKREMNIRLLAETFVKELVLRVHELVIKHQVKPRSLEINKGFKTYDPRLWLPRKDVIAKVGLGTGTREEKIQRLQILDGLQEKIKPTGLVADQETYALFTDMAKELGETNPEKYIINPDQNNPKYQQVMKQRQAANQAQPNQLAEAENVKGQYKLKEKELEVQYKTDKDEQQRNFDAAMKERDRQIQAFMDQMKESTAHQHEMHRIQADLLKHVQTLSSKEDIAALQAEVDLLKAGKPEDIGKPGLGAGIQKTFNPNTGDL